MFTVLLVAFNSAFAADTEGPWVSPPGRGPALGVRIGVRQGQEVPRMVNLGGYTEVGDDSDVRWDNYTFYRSQGAAFPLIATLGYTLPSGLRGSLLAGARPVRGERYKEWGQYDLETTENDYNDVYDGHRWHIQPTLGVGAEYVIDRPGSAVIAGVAFEAASVDFQAEPWFLEVTEVLRTETRSACGTLAAEQRPKPRLVVQARGEICASRQSGDVTVFTEGDVSRFESDPDADAAADAWAPAVGVSVAVLLSP